MTLSEEELARYQRHLSLEGVGAAGQERLKAARVLLVGAGGLGSPAALYLAAAGVGTLSIIDGDRVDRSNLQRQVLFETAQIGGQKATLARARLLALNPHIAVQAYTQDLDPRNARSLVRAHHVVVDGSDRLSTRYLVNDACVLEHRPLVSAAIHRFEGQAITYVPGRGPCYRCLFARAEEGDVPNCAEAGVLGVLPGVMGSLQATEAIKLILGIGEPLIGRLLIYDALEMRFSEFAFARRADCAVCGDAPSIRDIVATPPPPATRRLSAAQLRALVCANPRLTIVDVREPQEFAVAHLPRAINIPLATLPQRLGDVAALSAPIFVCRSGGRSLHAARAATLAGISNAADLQGGLLAWAAEVDSGFEVAPPP